MALRYCSMCEEQVPSYEIVTRFDSDRKTVIICPDCDLPTGWVCKWSTKHDKRFYFNVSTKCVQWGHPRYDNPLHIANEKPQASVNKRKKKLECPFGLAQGVSDMIDEAKRQCKIPLAKCKISLDD